MRTDLRSGRWILILIGLFLLLGLCGCKYFEKKPDFGDYPYEQDLPNDPVERAAILGLFESFNNTKMYELKDYFVVKVQPMIPSEAFVEEYDPKELYCVCVDFMARYKVPWNEHDEGYWFRDVRNILVIQTKGGHYLAIKPSGICPRHCM